MPVLRCPRVGTAPLLRSPFPCGRKVRAGALSKERPGFSLVPQFPAGEFDLAIASITILQTWSLCPGNTAWPLSHPCCPCAQWVLPGRDHNSSLHTLYELLCGAEIHFQDPSHIRGWFLLFSPAKCHRLLPKSSTFCLINHSPIMAKHDPLAWLPALFPSADVRVQPGLCFLYFLVLHESP